ncbi:MAG: chorismate mutase [Kribbellaceae bacterium]|jgi:chorismate mutase|nr:chorismate mutase [Kribbellaceae bacterium]
MKATKLIVRVLALGLIAAALAMGNQSSATAAQLTGPVGRLGGLTDLMIRRIEVGDDVAASKFGTDKPIDDPVREQQVLDSARKSAIELGLDPGETIQFFRDQIEASKVVQRGLFQGWAAHPSEAPKTRPDLSRIRIELDQLTTSLLRELVRTTSTRHADVRCIVELTTACVSGRTLYHLDGLHSRALTKAVTSVCAS